MQVYKANKNRSVLLDDSGSMPCVIKRFHHQNRWRALWDGARARGEFRALQRLQRLGLPVPQPLQLRLGPGAIQIQMQAIEGACSLEALLLGRQPPVTWERLMRSLGELLAQLQALGVEHPDLHPGNLLVDPAGKLYLVDPRGARVRRRELSRQRRLQALIAAEAESRDYLEPRLRLRCLAAWLQATPGLGRPDLAWLSQRALLKRRDFVEHGAGRWLRPSSRCALQSTSNGKIFESKLNPGFRSQARQPSEGCLQVEGELHEIRQLWLNSARCVEHRLPVVWPQRLEQQGSRARASFVIASSPGISIRGQQPEDLRCLAQRFRSRGLVPVDHDPGAWLADLHGGFLLPPPRELLNMKSVE